MRRPQPPRVGGLVAPEFMLWLSVEDENHFLFALVYPANGLTRRMASATTCVSRVENELSWAAQIMNEPPDY